MIAVLRLNHRLPRDERTTTHVFLTARAFLADRGYYTGEVDHNMEESIAKVSSQWGGTFTVEHVKHWGSLFSSFSGIKVHLTMYGVPLPQVLHDVQKNYNESKNLLVVVGGAKVPSELFHASDYNISITSQPHSEVAALAVFLNELCMGKAFSHTFPHAKLRIVPMSHGKSVKRQW